MTKSRSSIILSLGVVFLILHIFTASAQTAITMGETNILSLDDNGNGNMISLQKASLSQSGTAQSLSLYVPTAAGKVRLGIYDASGSGGNPGAKLVETAEFTPTTGWNTVPVASPATLSPGNYWIAYFPSSDNLHFRKHGSAGTYISYAQTYGALPQSLVSSTSNGSGTDHWSFYASFLAAGGTSPTPAPSPTPTPTPTPAPAPTPTPAPAPAPSPTPTQSGSTVSAASCSLADVQNAMNAASDGMTVTVPSGVCTWSGTLSVAKPVLLVGAGSGAGGTKIVYGGTNHALVSIDVGNKTGKMDVSGFWFQGGDANYWNGTAIEFHGPAGWKNLRIHHNLFDGNTQWTIKGDSHADGLIDHNTFQGTAAGIMLYGDGTADWAKPLTLGTSDFFFVEDNVFQFNDDYGNTKHPVMDMDSGGRQVFRYNIVKNGLWETHDKARSGLVSAQAFELYGNTVSASTNQWKSFDISAGTGVVWGNVVSGDVSFPIGLIDYKSFDPRSVKLCDGTDPADQNVAGQSGWRCQYQIGTLGEGATATSFPLYVWNNTYNGVQQGASCTSGCNHLLSGRDYFNNGTTAKSGYAPYTYPHPLQALSGTTVTPSPAPSPAPAPSPVPPPAPTPSPASSPDVVSEMRTRGRYIDWSQSGVLGGIPNRTTVCSALASGASKSAIQAALDACPSGQVVKLAAGTYNLTAPLFVPSNVTLRGEGPKQTILNASGSGSGLIQFGPGVTPSTNASVAITAGYATGSKNLTLSSASGVTVGSYLLITQLNDPSYVTVTTSNGTCTWCDGGDRLERHSRARSDRRGHLDLGEGGRRLSGALYQLCAYAARDAVHAQREVRRRRRSAGIHEQYRLYREFPDERSGP
jgi:pectin methylesterase-like acyl-CoA thioesterase